LTLPEQNIEKQYGKILDSITDGVYSVDLNWRITFFNRAAAQITGTPQKEAIGRSCLEVFRSNICETDCLLRETINTNKPLLNRPIYIIRADKKKIPVSATTTILKNADKEVIGGVVTFRDLTDIRKLRKELLKQHSYEDIVSKNPEMHRIFSVLPQVALSNTTVLIEGASGTGKELIARAIHNNSTHRQGPFVAVNCGALPDTLVESELFGYRAGAFTDAKTDKPGRFAQAQNGTLLLDEIGDISPVIQVRLLRVLQEKKYEPLGSNISVPTNARIIAATHHDLEALVKKGRFREDLYYRINIVKISLPAFADRKEDIPILVQHFIERFNRLTGKHIAGISSKAMAALMLYDWPGNIRELENAIEHAFVLCPDEMISISCLPEHVIPPSALEPISIGLTLKEIEKRAILKALEQHQWRRVATAKSLGIDKNSLRRKLIRLGIKPPGSRPSTRLGSGTS